MNVSPDFDENKDNPVLMSLGDHLDELRRYLIRVIIAVILAFVLLFINKNFLFSKIIFAPKESWFLTNSVLCNLSQRLNIEALCINSSPIQLINIQLAGQFSAHILVTFIAAVILVFPFILWQIWLFIKPGLFATEIRKFRSFVFSSSFLFFTGVLFAYFLIIPLALNFLGNYKVDSSVDNTISLMSYISTVSMVTLLMGIVFQMPVFVFFLTRIGWLTPQVMKKNRKIVFLALLILSAVITPPDVFSQLLVVFPLYFLYEISIIISSRQIKNIANLPYT